MNARPSFHVEHFTGVVGRMSDLEHFRRNIIICAGLHLLTEGENSVNVKVSCDGITPTRKPPRAAMTGANFMGRGSDALFDSGSVEAAKEAMNLNPIDWAFEYHTLVTDERYETLNAINVESNMRAKSLVEEDTVAQPIDFICYKLLGVYLSDRLAKSWVLPHQLHYLKLRPVFIDAVYIHENIIAAEDLSDLMEQVMTEVKAAVANRGNIRLS
ncbi:hypothetical protein [Ruegeria arenilitoris]|uniref:hypothetical protein n=1 Tax=Ruegeria arenilitoris TaxID=1173585 RepID=UPI00147FA6B2|nr:hypothetical protein [Ruegeria arenilitoris]